MSVFGLNVSLPESDRGDAARQFNIFRREFIDQVFRSERLEPIDKLIGFAISYHVNRETGCTFAHASTLAQDVGAKFHQACRALDRLDNAGHLRRKKRDHQVDLFPKLIVGASLPVMPAGTKKFQRDLREWLHKIIFNGAFTPACCVAAYAIAAHTDPQTYLCDPSHDVLADFVCLSPKTIQRSIKSLQGSDRISIRRQANSTSAISMVLDDVFEVGAGTRSMPTENLSFDEFQDISTIVINGPSGRVTIGGIIWCGKNLGLTIPAKKIIEAVRWGLLSQNGRYVTVTELGEKVDKGGQAAWNALKQKICAPESPGSRQS